MNEGYAHNVMYDFCCVSCGYSVRGVAIDQLCPECGTPVQASLGAGKSASGPAIAGMVLGIISVVGCIFYGVPSLICGPLAIYFSSVGKKQVREGSAARSSGGMATAGFVTGIVGTCIGVLVLAFFLLAILGVIAGSRGGGLGP